MFAVAVWRWVGFLLEQGVCNLLRTIARIAEAGVRIGEKAVLPVRRVQMNGRPGQ